MKKNVYGRKGKDEMVSPNKVYISVVVTLPFVITYMNYWLFEAESPPIVLEELYYIPLFLGILRFGFKGALWSYGVVSLAYVPFLFGIWAATSLAILDRFLHLLFSGIFAFLAGFLVDRERRHQEQSEKDRHLAGIGRTATTIVHDLKNPLITILAFAKRIREGRGNIDKAVQAIWDSAQNMQKIVESTLDFAGPIRLDMKEEDLTGIVNKVVDSCKAIAEESGVSLSGRVSSDVPRIAIDSHYMERALTNLVRNSIEASSAGENVIIKAEREYNDISIRIKDSGVGMDREVLENIFVPFYTNKSKGNGLGMSIAKKILEGHSGKIVVFSRAGQGTEVFISLPCRSSAKEKNPTTS